MLLILSPSGPASGSGNWRTASRYAALLADAGCRVDLRAGPLAADSLTGIEAALVLHARRSLPAARLLKAANIPYGVVLTGTDLYGDLADAEQRREANAQDCLETLGGAALAIGLQPDACSRLEGLAAHAPALPPCQTILQTVHGALAESPDYSEGPIQILMAGHLRAEKDPLTGLEAVAQAFPTSGEAVLHHAGGCLDESVCRAFEARVAEVNATDGPSVVVHGALPHEVLLQQFGQTHLFFHPSRVEGGSLVLSEAAAAGCPVLASRIPAHQAMLGEDYPGFFEPGNVADAAQQLHQFARDPSVRLAWRGGMVRRRSLLCDSSAERTSLLQVVALLSEAGGRQSST